MLKTIIKPIILILIVLTAIKLSLAIDFNVVGYIRETFDDNINSVIDGTIVLVPGMQPEEKKYDFITELMVGLGFRVEKSTQTLDFLGRFFSRIYSRNFKNTNYYEDAALNYRLNLSDQVIMTFADTFQHYPEQDRYESIFGRSQGSMWYWNNSFNFAGNFEMTKHLTMVLTYGNRYTHYFYKRTNEIRVVDYYYGNYGAQNIRSSLSQTVQLQQEIHWDSSNISFIYYSYTWLSQNPGAVSQAHNPGAGYRYFFTRQLYGEIRIGPNFSLPQIYIDPSQILLGNISIDTIIQYMRLKPYYLNVFANAMLVNQIDEITTARLSFTYTKSVIDQISDSFENWQLSGEVNRELINRLRVTSRIFYGQGRFFVQRRSTRMFGVNLTLGYEFTEHVTASVSYDFTFNTTHLEGAFGLRPWNNFVLQRNILNTEFNLVTAVSGYMRNRISIGLTAQM